MAGLGKRVHASARHHTTHKRKAQTVQTPVGAGSRTRVGTTVLLLFGVVLGRRIAQSVRRAVVALDYPRDGPAGGFRVSTEITFNERFWLTREETEPLTQTLSDKVYSLAIP